MCRIIVNSDASFEAALKHFSRKVQQAGIPSEARRKRQAVAQLRKHRRARF